MVDGWSNEKLKALKGRFYIDDDSDTINRDGRTNLVESLEEENPDGHCNLVEPSKIDNVLNNINIFERFTFVLILLQAIFGSELPKNKRVLKHGTMATQVSLNSGAVKIFMTNVKFQEFNIERITIQLDENGKIVKASIG